MDLEIFLIVLCIRSCNTGSQKPTSGTGLSKYPVKSINKECGRDFSAIEKVYEGYAEVEQYPWLGRLYYPVNDKKVTTIVVLITKELTIGPAFDIDKYPKDDFRERSKVVLGCNCSGPAIGIRDYTYHPDFKEKTLSALAIIQLDINDIKIELHPICMPSTDIENSEFYAMTLARDCNSSKMKIFKMVFVDPEECKIFYRKSGLDLDNMWPTYTACAQALSGGKCVWRNGALLVLRQGRRWRLVGIGVYGPGCQTPARFLDYGMYHSWVRSTITNMGRVAVTRIAPNELIVRRSFNSMQRFGSCDPEETKAEIFIDNTVIYPGHYIHTRTASYNLTLFANVDYSCIILRVSDMGIPSTPRIHLKRWCLTPMPACYEFHYLQVEFMVEIHFTMEIEYKVLAYGREVRLIERKSFMAYFNRKKSFPHVPRYYLRTRGSNNLTEMVNKEVLRGAAPLNTSLLS